MPVNTKQLNISSCCNTKKYIIGAARNLFSEFSYLGVSMSDIAKKLNITKAALYYHFTGKAEIYKKVLEEVFNDLKLSIDKVVNKTTADEQQLNNLIKNYLEFGFQEKNLIRAFILKLSSVDPQIREYIIQLRKRIIGLIQPVIEKTLAQKSISQKIDSRLLTSLLTSMMDGLLLEHSLLNKKIDLEKALNQITAVLL